MSEEQQIFFTVQTPSEQKPSDSKVIFHDYSQIQIVNDVSSSPAKKKFIFLSEGEEGAENYGQQLSQTSTFSFSETNGKTAPLMMDPNVSGAVESVIEVSNSEHIGNTEQVQTFTFEEEKFTLMDDDEEQEDGLVKPCECELCKKSFQKLKF